MRSRDIAGLAGVTPRALRHYHQIGLLPEPLRDRNGYRRYDVQDLVRLFRIKSLASAGVVLGDIPAFLESRGATDDLLDVLDQQLVAQMNRLKQQRRMVARLRKVADGPDPESGRDRALDRLSGGRSQAATEAWREQIILFSHLLDPADMAKLDAIYARLARDPEAFLALGKKFDALGPHSSDQEIASLAREYADHFQDIFLDFEDLFKGPAKKGLFKLIFAHTISTTNESQKKILAVIESFMK